MSTSTLSPRIHALTPADELIGSMTKERVELLVRQAGAQSLEDSDQAGRWLAYAVEADVPYSLFQQVNAAYSEYEDLKECDLMYWYDEPESMREPMLATASDTIDVAVSALVIRICSALRITK